jgi:hypothetical protein
MTTRADRPQLMNELVRIIRELHRQGHTHGVAAPLRHVDAGRVLISQTIKYMSLVVLCCHRFGNLRFFGGCESNTGGSPGG